MDAGYWGAASELAATPGPDPVYLIHLPAAVGRLFREIQGAQAYSCRLAHTELPTASCRRHRLTPARFLSTLPAMSGIHIMTANLGDWPHIERVYREGIRTKLATLNTEADVPRGPDWFRSKLPNLVFKATDDAGRFLGWAALSAVSGRRVYRGVAEVSVYVAADARGQGVGSALLAHLVHASEQAGLWTLQAGIFPEKKASILLHQHHGFRIVGIRERIAQLDGVWRDVALMERRSPVV